MERRATRIRTRVGEDAGGFGTRRRQATGRAMAVDPGLVAVSSGSQLSPHSVLALQRLAGNRATSSLIARLGSVAVQRNPVDSDFGTFTANPYEVKIYDKNYGTPANPKMKPQVLLSMRLEFSPNDKVKDATGIGLTQSIRNYRNNQPTMSKPSDQSRNIAEGSPGGGYVIDRTRQHSNNPMYGATDLKPDEGLQDTEVSGQGHGLGHRYSAGEKTESKSAWLDDAPETPAWPNSGQILETTALVIKGGQKGKYLGSVKWGWKSQATDQPEKLPLELVSPGDPSANFTEPAKRWNAGIVSQKGGGPSAKTAKDKTELFNLEGRPETFTLDKGRNLRFEDVEFINDRAWAKVAVLGYPLIAGLYLVRFADIEQAGTGQPVKLDIPG